jgi:hypothetical protein
METLLATFLLFSGVVAAMAIGVMVHGRRLKGSCGGTGGECPCDDAAQQECDLKRLAASQRGESG